MKALETTEHAQVDFFILIIRVPHYVISLSRYHVMNKCTSTYILVHYVINLNVIDVNTEKTSKNILRIRVPHPSSVDV